MISIIVPPVDFLFASAAQLGTSADVPLPRASAFCRLAQDAGREGARCFYDEPLLRLEPSFDEGHFSAEL
jgi:hypothetical protein